MPEYKDISGQKFGRLTAIKRVGKNKHSHSLWKCQCNCGNETVVELPKLTTEHTKSCGCLREEKMREKRLKHGATIDGKSRLYEIWCSMRSRCHNENKKNYKNYGGRGIKICETWEKSFEKFRSWANNNGYSDNLEIDRIDNLKGYYPENCRWVVRGKQMNNKRNNVHLRFNGKTKTIAEWAKETGISYNTLYARINKLNWSVEKALTTPVKGR